MDFVGMDPHSPADKCPAVHVEPATGDLYLVGRQVTDPATLAKLAEHASIEEDETAIWMPARMGPFLREAVTGDHEPGRQGRGEPTLSELLAGCRRSVVHLEARDTYDATDPAFLKWRENGDTSYDWDGWVEKLSDAIARGVRFRRLRIVSEPVSDYIRWEHAISYGNVRAGEELRWLPRRLAFDLAQPVADYFMFNQRLIRYNFTAGDGTDTGDMKYVTDPRQIVPVVGQFEMLWERAVPHEDYDPS
ncbi:DUF6879 family protein [Actinomadura hibisca]|uniref:DUF6879 family protein n=1 Tax=Actinomadura hibisca TaxID=68565 RepID=UPI000A4B2C3C|nr:DUF6879 family protein [Actinomadura hibisca]